MLRSWRPAGTRSWGRFHDWKNDRRVCVDLRELVDDEHQRWHKRRHKWLYSSADEHDRDDDDDDDDDGDDGELVDDGHDRDDGNEGDDADDVLTDHRL